MPFFIKNQDLFSFLTTNHSNFNTMGEIFFHFDHITSSENSHISNYHDALFYTCCSFAFYIYYFIIIYHWIIILHILLLCKEKYCHYVMLVNKLFEIIFIVASCWQVIIDSFFEIYFILYITVYFIYYFSFIKVDDTLIL